MLKTRKKSDDVFQIIRSMTKSEKRYFKLLASKSDGESNNNLSLFNTIEKQTQKSLTYDEDKVVKDFSKSKFSNHLFSTKNYLLHHLLDSLILFHSGSSNQIKIKKLLSAYSVLYDKGLLKVAGKTLQQAKRIAWRYEYENHLLEILNFEYELAAHSDIRKRQAIVEERKELLAKIMELHHLQSISNELRQFVNKQATARTEQELEGFKNLIKHGVLKNPDKLSFIKSKHLYFDVHSVYHYIQGDLEKTNYYFKQCFILYQSLPPDIQRERVDTYISTLSNSLIVNRILKQHKEFSKNSSALKSIPKKFKLTSLQKTDLYERVYDKEIAFLNQLGQFKKAKNLIAEIKDFFTRQIRQPNLLETINFKFAFAYTSIGCKDYKGAVTYLNDIFNSPRNKKRADLYTHALLLNLICHHELQNREVLASQILVTQKFLKTRKKQFKAELILLNLYRQLNLMGQKSSEEIYYRAALNSIIKMQRDKFESKSNAYFNYVCWIESKLMNKDFSEMVVKESI